jgi:rubrerythrin
MTKTKFEDSKTMVNLARGFAGECQDGARYQYLADLAQQQQYYEVAKVLKSLATNEMSHAKVYFDAIISNCDGVVNNVPIEAGFPFKKGDFVEMFKYEMENEKSEGLDVYPSFATTAKDEGYSNIAKIFDEVSKVEQRHAEIMSTLHERLKKDELYDCCNGEKTEELECCKCGYTCSCSKPWEECPLCGAKSGYIKLDKNSL